jgi:hypothetical protein
VADLTLAGQLPTCHATVAVSHASIATLGTDLIGASRAEEAIGLGNGATDPGGVAGPGDRSASITTDFTGPLPAAGKVAAVQSGTSTRRNPLLQRLTQT